MRSTPAQGVIYTVRTFDDDTSLATTAGWDERHRSGLPPPRYYTATGHWLRRAMGRTSGHDFQRGLKVAVRVADR